jgi:hypothetical protein
MHTRRQLLIASLALLPATRTLAHHGWSSFDQGRPVWLEGTARRVAWRNPHAEFDLELPANPVLPADLTRRVVPAQQATVDAADLLARARLPARRDRVWRVELAPLTRMQAWGLAGIAEGEAVGVLGFELADPKAAPLVRAEFLFVAGKALGLRSSPAG